MTQADVVWRIPSYYKYVYLASLIGDQWIDHHCIQNIFLFWGFLLKAWTTINFIDKIVVIKIASTSLNIRYVKKDLDA